MYNRFSKSRVSTSQKTKLPKAAIIIPRLAFDMGVDDTQVLCWNVNGLERMLLQFDLFTHLEKCSIFALTETWKDQQLKNKPTGFHLYESLAQRDHKKGRSSGGIIVGIREAIKDKIERTEIEKQWIMICLRLDGELRIKSAMVQNGMQIEIKANNSLSKPWFDHECYVAKKIMKAALTKYIKSNRDLDRLEYGNISISDWQQFYNKLLDTEPIPDYELLTKRITLNEISKEISPIRHGKATGFDDITNEAIKALSKDYLIP
ncbi:hypothetical protein LAZ67_X000003 [Cordylochernes scorpioides]|uniref:Uncharacterized protein n=1 Tax=Cordylochernes scorpioides TaxID=51811 RepID=A0ABY6LUE5_9ARAC|nr:hypothetical protein LAZ67_X000003 [Cordylochernes scorpioides]